MAAGLLGPEKFSEFKRTVKHVRLILAFVVGRNGQPPQGRVIDMNKTTHAHRLYTVLALVAGMMLLAVIPAVAGTDVPGPERHVRELDGWINARLADTNSQPVKSGGPVLDDGWARGGGLRSISAAQAQPVPVDGWAIGQGMRSQTAPSSTAVQSPSTPISLSTIVLGLLFAAVLGAGTAAVFGHRRHVPSAH